MFAITDFLCAAAEYFAGDLLCERGSHRDVGHRAVDTALGGSNGAGKRRARSPDQGVRTVLGGAGRGYWEPGCAAAGVALWAATDLLRAVHCLAVGLPMAIPPIHFFWGRILGGGFRGGRVHGIVLRLATTVSAGAFPHQGAGDWTGAIV